MILTIENLRKKGRTNKERDLKKYTIKKIRKDTKKKRGKFLIQNHHNHKPYLKLLNNNNLIYLNLKAIKIYTKIKLKKKKLMMILIKGRQIQMIRKNNKKPLVKKNLFILKCLILKVMIYQGEFISQIRKQFRKELDRKEENQKKIN